MRTKAHANGDTTFTFTKPELKALLAHASKDATREHLYGVCLDEGALAAIVTDGHRLARVTADKAPADPSDDGKQAILPRDGVERIYKALDAKGKAHIRPNCTKATVIVEPRSCYAEAEDPSAVPGAITFEEKILGKGDAQFPPYLHIIPAKQDKEKAAPLVGFDTRYLGDLALVAQAAEKTTGIMAIRPPVDTFGPLRADVENFEDGSAWTVIVMPARV